MAFEAYEKKKNLPVGPFRPGICGFTFHYDEVIKAQVAVPGYEDANQTSADPGCVTVLPLVIG